ncbi:MAG: hypothetical protein KJ601_02425 [Nanoarchaeota archaeon]|nr:hypothetical protein [Nanoarchaeota archaeon]MBU1704842.1 hypothetical protein [Nanoarchaeota archaeon]
MISSFRQIEELFKEIDKELVSQIHIFTIGGAVLLYQGLRPATKDIDIIVENKAEFDLLKEVLMKLDFKGKLPELSYKHMNLSQVLVRDDFRIDLFHKTVCSRFSLSKEMIKRSKSVIRLNNVVLSLCSNEDIFIFKTMTEREGDLNDCVMLAQTGLDWGIILKELKSQTKEQDVWITWVGERMDILKERGLNIPIMQELDTLRMNYHEKLEKRYGK